MDASISGLIFERGGARWQWLRTVVDGSWMDRCVTLTDPISISIQSKIAMVTISPLSLYQLLPKSIKTLLLTPNPNPNPNQKPKPNVKLTISRRDAVLSLSALIAPLQPLPLAAAGPTVGECELTVTPSGLGFCDQVVGTGAAASKGQLIKAHYVGRLENGKVFDSSYNRGKPLTFRVGLGEVIKGWDQGILGGDGIPPMLSGGKRTLKIPPELAYGARGAGCRGGSCLIPPDSTLLFDVEFIGKI
ncbi:peptidyl-prolyl cis-trans isomerase FKBP13 [Carex littledalei]|uniref:peptidylprolyl isomerase n=1 Tax=Carex littledalei TaxID=544730 RepID=A0A833QTQ1_9POAL|nr:peptidyl-prolyl cis-trans isomerase FKBP13 [Carex littledalei]